MASEASFSAVERTECRAFGTVKVSDLQSLQDLLNGLSGSHGLPFRRHEVVLKNFEKPPVLVHLIQILSEEEKQSDGISSSSSSNASRSRRYKSDSPKNCASACITICHATGRFRPVISIFF